MTDLTIAEIANQLGADAVGEIDLRPRRLRQPDEAEADDLALAMDAEFAGQLTRRAVSMAVIAEGADWQASGLRAAIVVSRPRYAMATLSRLFDRGEAALGIHPTAVVDPTAILAPDVSVGPLTVIGARVRIAAGGRIGAQVFIGDDAVIGERAQLMPGCRIGSGVRIGDRFIGQMNAVIGGDGFSFVTAQPSAVERYMADGTIGETMDATRHERINSLGAVVVGDDVEVGACSVIDKGTVSDTRIGSGAKIDAQVMVGHNVSVGENALLCGQAGIAGSTKIGDRVVLGGKVGVADHISIGDDSIVLANSGVTTRIPPRTVSMGFPAIRQDTFVKMYRAMRRLPMMAEKLDALHKRVSNPDDKS